MSQTESHIWSQV